MFECKAGRLRIDTKTTADPMKMLRDLTKTSIPALRQLARSIDELNKAGEAECRLADVKEPWPVVVHGDQVALINSTPFTRLIDAELADAGVDFTVRHQGIDVGDLETLAAVGSADTVVQLVAEKASDAELATCSFKNHLQPPRVGDEVPQNGIIATKWDAICEDLKARLVS